MDNNLFRKKSISRVNSPEQLNEYIRVAKPGVWVVLVAIIFLLVGIFVWGIFGTIHTTVKTGTVVDGDTALCYVTEDSAAQIKEGMKVTVGGVEGTVTKVSASPAKMAEGADDYLQYLTGMHEGDFCYAVALSVEGVDDGVYETVITVDSIHPITFIIH